MGKLTILKHLRREDLDFESDNKTDALIMWGSHNLDPKQQEFIRKSPNHKNIFELAKECFKDNSITKHSWQFSSVKKYFTRCKTGTSYPNFTDEEIEFILNNAADMTPREIAVELFSKKDFSTVIIAGPPIKLLADIFQVVYEGPNKDEVERLGDAYEPPKTDHEVSARIKLVAPGEGYVVGKFTTRERENVEAVKRYCKTPRFVVAARSITRRSWLELYETEFIRAVYDKPDLNSEDINQYISICNEYLLEAQLIEQMNAMNEKLSMAVGDDENTRKFSMTLSNALDTKAGELNTCRQRTLKMQLAVSGARAKRVEAVGQLNESLLKFVELATSEEGRKKYQRLKQAKTLEIQGEISRIENFEELIAEIHGISIEEIIRF